MDVATFTSDRQFRNPTRQLRSILAPLEKRCLVWMAERLPGWINSDHLTVLALAAMAGAGASYAFARVTPFALLAVVVFLAVNWFGDSLDGTLARVRRCERPRYGFYVDHVVDLLGTAFLLAGLGASGYMSPFVAFAVFSGYLLVCSEVYLRTCSMGTFRMSFLMVGPTELRILLAIGTLAAMVHPNAVLFGRAFLLFDVSGVIAAAALAITFLGSAWAGTKELYQAERLGARGAEPPHQLS
jgi:phosphatidylglycerophosphate synthase